MDIKIPKRLESLTPQQLKDVGDWIYHDRSNDESWCDAGATRRYLTALANQIDPPKSIVNKIEEAITEATMRFKTIRLIVLGNKENDIWLQEAKALKFYRVSLDIPSTGTNYGSVKIVVDTEVTDCFEVYY